MMIIGIETSCDETAVALVEGDREKKSLKVVSSIVSSSAELQARFGGIIPEQAARQQVKVMIPVLDECLKKMGSPELTIQTGMGIDAIAVTVGPGLIGSLLVGVETAKTLAYLWKKPIIPVNHLVAHLYANFIGTATSEEAPEFPAIGLVVSGGHTDMVVMKSHENLELIGSTRDDAAGECFDKSARMLGLPYPGGPEIARLAEEYLNKLPKGTKLKMFPRPLASQDNFDWSFSGLKTSILYYLRDERWDKEEDKERQLAERERISAEIQEAICDSLVIKLGRAIEAFKPRSVLVAGGVAANKQLRLKLERLNKGTGWKLFVPEPKLCTDNGSYIAAYAFYHQEPVHWTRIKAEPGLMITTRI